MNNIEFLDKANVIHNNKYKYPNLGFTKLSDFVDIDCPEHGLFRQKVSVHINDRCGCPKCGLKYRLHPHKKTKAQFEKDAIKVHGDTYDYSKSDYKSANAKLIIICSKHGEFLMQPSAHITQKQGCPKCGLENRILPNQKTTSQFIQQAKNKWNDLYDYSITVYVNKHTKIKYICHKHGEVEQKPFLHLKHGCQFCNGRGISKHTSETFIDKAREKHGDTFDYSETKYIGSHDLIDIRCQKHGVFRQMAYMHLQSEYCCPLCVAELTSSAAEKEITDFIKKYYNGKIINNDRSMLGYKEIDIFLPELNFGIEFHGNYWHTEPIVGKNYHAMKANLAEKKNINLVQIFEYEWESKKDIVKSRLLSSLGVNKKIAARKTEIYELSKPEKNFFLRATHLQGKDNSSIFYGLKYEGLLVACMTFGKPRFDKNYDYELIRYSSDLYTNVIGGASKLFIHFKRNFSGSVVSYADRRWSTGRMYEYLGFKEEGKTEIGYVYYDLNSKTIHNRMKFQKHKLKKLPFYDEKSTEYDIMKTNGYERIWNAGNIKWVYK